MNINRSIDGEVICDAPIKEVWKVWTTVEGITSFFAPKADIQLKVGGKFELFFLLDNEPGQRGSEGCQFLAIQPFKMLSFTWNAPPHLSDVRDQRTHVAIRFEEISAEQTKVILHHDGWGIGGQWENAFEYFTSAWSEMVLPHLKKRFEQN